MFFFLIGIKFEIFLYLLFIIYIIFGKFLLKFKYIMYESNSINLIRGECGMGVKGILLV